LKSAILYTEDHNQSLLVFQDIRVAEEGDQYIEEEGHMGEINKKINSSSKKKKSKQTYYMQF
jgi:hypothetical protein